MRIINPNYPYVISKDLTISELLILFKKNKGLPVVVKNFDGTLFGIISKGDLIEFLSQNLKNDFEIIKAEIVANQYPIVGHHNDSFETIEGYLVPDDIQLLPIIDHNRIIKKLVTKEIPSINFQEKIITESSYPYLIAEIGVNHNGKISEAKKLIESAAKAGCDAVKFQHRTKNTYSKYDIDSYDLGTQYILSEIERTNLSLEELLECAQYSNSLGIHTIVTPFDELALEEVIESGIKLSALKIASCDLTNLPLIESCSKTNLPLILSTGMSFEREIIKVSKFLSNLMVEHAFLHCNSTYPAPIEDTNLSYIKRLKDISNVVVGFSSHEGNIHIPLASISYGAKIIEFHITESKKLLGTDHRASIEIEKLNELVLQSKIIFKSGGDLSPRIPTQGELSNKLTLGKSYALNKFKKKGHVINKKDLVLISPGSGFNVDQIHKLIGKKLTLDCEARRILKPNNIEGALFLSAEKIRNTFLGLKANGYIAGIPIRYHDLKELYKLFDPKLLEFHMSDRDLNLSPEDYITHKLDNVDLIVHAVEQYEDGFIFDIASDKDEIINRSFQEIERLIKHIDKLRNYFKNVEKIPIVINLGGFTENDFLDKDESSFCLERCISNLNKINNNFSEYTLMPQTMPPFPWHQGGRSYHNLLTSHRKVEDFLNSINNPICLDISHTALSCFYFGENIVDHINLIGNRINHIHLSDAQGQNAEGLEVGSGTLDFKSINNAILNYKKDVYLIPEIWQGHLYQGEKFAKSLLRFQDLIS